MTAAAPSISIVIPAWNEEVGLPGCLAAVARQTWDPADIEVIVVDGASTDGTVETARRCAEELNLSLRVLSNPVRRTSSSLNVGLGAARGRVVVRLDARSRVQADYVERCAEVLATMPDVGVVGGAQVATAANEGLEARGIARSLRNRWFTGLSRYRRSSRSGPSDTVWMGVFRSADLRAMGGWDPAIALNEDFDLNRRYLEAGRLVWFDAGLRSTYVARPDMRALAVQHFRFGRVKGTWWARGQTPNARQVVLLVAPVGAVGAAWVAARRIGTVPTALAAVGAAFALDHLGAESPPATVSERSVALVAAATSTSAWLVGVAVGLLGERVGLGHPYG